MRIISAEYFGIKIFFFSDINNSVYIPDIWIFYDSKSKSWRICGIVNMIDLFIPDKFRKLGFKNSSEAFSYLHSLYNFISSLTIKQKIKYCLTNKNNIEYNRQLIYKFNQAYRDMKTKTK